MLNQTTATTPTGRAVAALNHLTHGGTSQTLFLKDEDPAEFFSLLESAFELHQPTNPQDSGLVTDSVLARWFLARRQRIYIDFEATLHARKPEAKYWVPVDMHELELFDRYKTQAERALKRALANVQQIRKDAFAQQRWQAQHELQKQRFALDRERFELAKQKEARLTAKEEAQRAAAEETKAAAQEAEPEPVVPVIANLPLAPFLPTALPQFQQTLFIGYENDVTTVYEITPSNNQIRRRISEDDQVLRTYNFVGGVPPAYEHLITPDAYRFGASTSVRKILSCEEWSSLADNE